MPITGLIKRSPYVKLENNRSYHVLAYTTIIGLVWHFMLIGYFAFIGVYPMALVNVVSCTMWLVVIRLNYLGRLRLVLGLIAVEMFGHAVFAVYYVGVAPGFHYYMLSVIPIVFFNVAYRIRLLLAMVVMIYSSYALVTWLGKDVVYSYRYANILPTVELVNILFTMSVFVLCSLHFRSSASIAEKKLMKLAETDPLTRLKNRRSILPHLNELDKSQQPNTPSKIYALADIDHFKKINDQYGHQVGDVVLFDVARILKNRLRESDMVARWGGEEFLLIFSGLSPENAEWVVNGIRELIAKNPICTNNHEIYVTMSFGVALARAGESHEQVVSRADEALYQAKADGRNRVVVADTPSLQQRQC